MNKKEFERLYAEQNFIIDNNEFDADEYEAVKEIAKANNLNKYVLVTNNCELDAIYVYCTDVETAVNAILTSITYINSPDETTEFIENYIKSNIYTA